MELHECPDATLQSMAIKERAFLRRLLRYWADPTSEPDPEVGDIDAAIGGTRLFLVDLAKIMTERGLPTEDIPTVPELKAQAVKETVTT